MKRIAFTLFVVAACLTMSYELADSGTYYRYNWPDVLLPPGNGWTVVGTTPPALPDVGDMMWIGKDNNYVSTNTTSWTIEYFGSRAQKCYCYEAKGFKKKPDGTAEMQLAGGCWPEVDLGSNGRRWSMIYQPQPDFQWVCLQNWGPFGAEGQPDAVVFRENHICFGTYLTYDTLRIGNAWFGDSTCDTMNMTVLEIFPGSVPVDPSGEHVLVAPGTWTSEIVYVDPDGYDRPLGGVRWTLQGGDGLAAGQVHSFTMIMSDSADTSYSYYAFNDIEGAYDCFELVATSGSGQDIPTLTEWGMIIFGVVLLGFITWVFFRRRKAIAVRF
jgi:hypothetical protein